MSRSEASVRQAVFPRQLALIFAAVVVFAAFQIAFPRFQAIDEVAFKSAGREFSESGHFASPEMAGFRNLDPPVEYGWFAQFPLYTFFFGLFVSVARFGASQNILFDVLIQAALVFLTYGTARRALDNASPSSAAVAALAVLPLMVAGRPDVLAMCWGMSSLLLMMHRTSPIATFTSGLLLGLCGATGPVTGFCFALQAAAWIAGESTTGRWKSIRLSIVAAGAIGAFVLSLAPFLLAYEGVERQFFMHAQDQVGAPWLESFSSSLRFGFPFLASGLFQLVGCFILLFVLPRGRWFRYFAVPLFLLAAIVIFLPSKYLYLWFLAPWVAAGLAGSWGALNTRTRILIATVSATTWLVAAAPHVKDTLIVAFLPTEQTLSYNVARIRQYVPRGSSVLSSEYWGSIAGEYDYRFRYAVPDNPPISDVNYVLLTANGSGLPGSPQRHGAVEELDMRTNFETIYDNLNAEPFTLTGVRVTNSAWGFGVRILKRVKTSSPQEPFIRE